MRNGCRSACGTNPRSQLCLQMQSLREAAFLFWSLLFSTTEQLEALVSVAVPEDFTDFAYNYLSKYFAIRTSMKFPLITLQSVENSCLAFEHQRQVVFMDLMVQYRWMSGTVTCLGVPGKHRPRCHSAPRLHWLWALSVLSFLGGKEPCPATMPSLLRHKEQNAHV